MEERPSQSVDRMFTRDRAKSVEMKIVFRSRDGMLLKQPTALSDHACRRLELSGHGVIAANPFAKPGDTEEVIANCAAALTEIIRDSRLHFLRRIRRIKRPHPNRQLVLPPQFQRVFFVG